MYQKHWWWNREPKLRGGGGRGEVLSVMSLFWTHIITTYSRTVHTWTNERRPHCADRWYPPIRAQLLSSQPAGTRRHSGNNVVFLQSWDICTLKYRAILQYPGHLHREIVIFSQKSLRTIYTYHLVPFKLPKNVQRGPFQGLLVFRYFFQKISNFTKYALTPLF